jgi:GTP-binding protein HflX
MLVRGGAPTFGQISSGGLFSGGNMMRMEVAEMEIKSARGRKAGNVGGEGETQLEMERRRLTDREAKISKEIETLRVKSEHEKAKKEASHQTLPLVGLIGYTNAGKTALMNLCTGANLESKDLLF